jgi:putative membrane protein
MSHFAKGDPELIALCLHEIELRSEAEVVLVVRKISGNYRDIDYLFGGALAFLSLCLILFCPWEIDDFSIPLPVLLVFFAGAWFCRATHLRRYLTRKKRREHAVRHAAEATFIEKGLHLTSKRTGILLYLSTLEGRGEILADRGASERITPEKLEHFRRMLEANVHHRKRGRHLGTFLRSLGVYLGEILPSTADSKEHEIHCGAELEASDGEGE